MKTQTLWTTLTVVGILAATGWAAGQTQNQQQQQGPTATAPAPAALTETEITNLQYLRNEEKLARDVYRALALKWDCPIFTHIAVAEQRHFEAVGLLITKYGVTDPVTDDASGAFGDATFTDLYADLTASGTASLLDALRVGVVIEEGDIASLETALEYTDRSDIGWVLGNLLRGSQNHLQAFNRVIEAGGVCPHQGVSVSTGNGKSADNGVCPGSGRGGRGNGKGWRSGNGTFSQNGAGQGNGLHKRDGTCLTMAPAQS
jgi:hypothetical protein